MMNFMSESQVSATIHVIVGGVVQLREKMPVICISDRLHIPTDKQEIYQSLKWQVSKQGISFDFFSDHQLSTDLFWKLKRHFSPTCGIPTARVGPSKNSRTGRTEDDTTV